MRVVLLQLRAHASADLVGTAVAINPDSDLRELAKNRGWEIRDFRTGRKAAKVGVPTALVLGAAGGALAAVATRRKAVG